MTDSQLPEKDLILERVVDAQSLIAEVVARLENSGGGNESALDAISQGIEALNTINLALVQSKYEALTALTQSLIEYLMALRDDNQGLVFEEVLALFDWTAAVGMYIESPAEPELIEALLSPLPEERKAEALEALAAESPEQSDEGLADDESDTLVFPDEEDIIAGNLVTEEFDISMFAPEPEDADSAEEEESILGILLVELSQISPQLTSLAILIVGADKSEAERAGESYLELVGRLSTACEGLGLDGLLQVTKFIEKNLWLALEGSMEVRVAVQPLLAGWCEVVQEHLREPLSDELCLAVVDYLEQKNWPEPLAYKDLRILLEGLTKELVVTGDYEEEARTSMATSEDVSLEIDQDVSQQLMDAFLSEAPGHAEELTRLVGEIIVGNQVVENTQALQRIAHTLKGSANLLALKGVANLAHHLEDIFEYLVKKSTVPPQGLGLCLQEATDTIEAMLEAVQGFSQPPTDAQRVLQDVLDWANRIDRGLREADQNITDAESAPVSGKSAQQSSGAAAELDLLRVSRGTVDSIFKLVGETSIALGQIQERLKRLRADSGMVRSQDMILQQRRFDLENLISVRGMAAQQSRLGTSQNFDPLEMDEYNEFYGTANAFIEAVADSREASRQVADEHMRLEALYLQQHRLNRELQEIAMNLRMVKVKTISARLQRSVRQACRATGKQVELQIIGEDLLLDGDVLNKLVDPLMHILRNAVDHGIESPEGRAAENKSQAGKLVLLFRQKGNNIIVCCTDDGRGLDYQRIREKAVAKGLLGATEEAENSLLTRVILQPGFSTRDQATHVSGRGVGMDVVNSTLMGLRGSIDISDNTPSGTEITLRLPITLLTSHSLLVRAGDKHFAIPTATLEQILSPDAGRFETLGSNVTYQLGEEVYSARSLPELLSMTTAQDLLTDNKTPVLLVRVDNEIHAVVVNQVIGSYELVVKSLGQYVGSVRGISGVSVLGDGDVVPVLDLVELLTTSTAAIMPRTSQETAWGQPEQASLPQVLIVDDSLSVRKSLSQLLEDASMQPLVARDGVEALEVMRKQKPDLVLTDLEMPRMSGLELSAHIRASEETRDMPVIMITSRTTQKHRNEAERSGVDLYVTKPFSEDDLVNDINSMLVGKVT